MSNHRSDCYYCKTAVLSRDLGSHILRKHEREFFTDKDNLKSLYRDKYFKEPLQMTIGVDTYHFCLADNSCIRKSITALQHFKGKEDKHRETILSLREKYPLEGGTETTAAPAQPLFSARDKQRVQEELCELMMRIVDLENKADDHMFTQSKRVIEIFRKMGLKYDIVELKEEYPNLFPDEEKEEEEEEEEEQPEQPEKKQEQPEQPEQPEKKQEQPEQPEESVSFNEKKIVHTPAPSIHAVSTLPKQNFSLNRQTQPRSSYPQVKIISNTKTARQN